MTKYPYDIPPPPLNQIAKKFNRRELWNALEFFRIEALLRSKKVWTLFRKAPRRRRKAKPEVKSVHQWIVLFGQNKFKLRGNSSSIVPEQIWDKTLRNRFALGDGWAILVGSHHRHLKLNRTLIPVQNEKATEHSSIHLSDGILDLSALARRHNSSFNREGLKEDQKRFLYLRIDCAVAPENTVKVLRRLLQDRHKDVTLPMEKPSVDPNTWEQTIPFHPRKNPPIDKVHIWLKYLQCYDLRHRDGLTYGAIGTQVYGNDESGDSELHARQAVYRFTLLIAAAEKNAWPPTNLSSSKKA